MNNGTLAIVIRNKYRLRTVITKAEKIIGKVDLTKGNKRDFRWLRREEPTNRLTFIKKNRNHEKQIALKNIKDINFIGIQVIY